MNCPACSVDHVDQVVKCLIGCIAEGPHSAELARARTEAELAEPLTRIATENRALADLMYKAVKDKFFPDENCVMGTHHANCVGAAHLANSVVAWLNDDLSCPRCGSIDIRQPHCGDLSIVERCQLAAGEFLAAGEELAGEDKSLCHNCHCSIKPIDTTVLSIHWERRPRRKYIDRCFGVSSISVWTRWMANVCHSCSTKLVVGHPLRPRRLTGWDFWDAADQVEFSETPVGEAEVADV